MTAPAQQLQFVWRAARYLPLCAKPIPEEPLQAAQLARGKAFDLDKLLKLQAEIVEALPETAAGHFNIREQKLRQMAEEAAAWGAAGDTGGASVSAISLESVGDALQVRPVWHSCS